MSQEQSCLIPYEVYELNGPDGLDYLNRICTQNFKAAPHKHMAYAAFLDRKGHLLVDFSVWILAQDSLLIAVTKILSQTFEENFNKFLFAENIELKKSEFKICAHWTLNQAPTIAQPYDNRLSQNNNYVPIALSTSDTQSEPIYTAQPLRYRGAMSLQIASANYVQTLAQKNNFVPPEQFKIHEILLGVARIGDEIDQALLLETGLEDVVIRNKGCYTGQEIIERIYAKGNVTKTMVQLKIHSSDGQTSWPGPALKIFKPGIELLDDQQEIAGTLLSLAQAPQNSFANGMYALGLLKRKYWAANEALFSLRTSDQTWIKNFKAEVLWNGYSKRVL